MRNVPALGELGHQLVGIGRVDVDELVVDVRHRLDAGELEGLGGIEGDSLGVSLAGGRGGMLGPIAAAFLLSLIRTDLVFLGVNSDYSQVIQGAILVIVVMIGGLVELRRRRA